MKNVLAIMAFLATGILSVPACADINGFSGPFDPVDSSGNLINGFTAGPLGNGNSFSAVLSPDKSTLTMDFVSLNGNQSIFFQNANPLPAGTIAYNWSIDFLQSGSWLLETDVSTTFPGGDNFGDVTAGVYSGTATYNYDPANPYFSFGNVGFGDGAHEAILTLTNFQYTGLAVATPEPSTVLILGAGLVTLIFLPRRLRRD